MSSEKPVLVLGGGIAGLAAAEGLARNDIPVILLEKESHLGGNVAGWACMASEQCHKCGACLVEDLRRKALDNTMISIYTRGTVEKTTRNEETLSVHAVPVDTGTEPCTSSVGDLAGGVPLGTRVTWEVDAVFLATGFEPFSAQSKPLLGYGKLASVLTTVDLNRVLREDRIALLPAAQKDTPKIAFLQCVGSRDRESGRDYCSQVCCKTSLRLANKLLYERPGCEITVFYIDLQVVGKGCRTFFKNLEHHVRLIQGVPSEVVVQDEGSPALVYEDPEDGLLKTEVFDLVVLAVGMVPRKDTVRLAHCFGVPLGKRGFFEKMHGGSGSRIYTIGSCRAPVDISGTVRQAMEAVGHYACSRRS